MTFANELRKLTLRDVFREGLQGGLTLVGTGLTLMYLPIGWVPDVPLVLGQIDSVNLTGSIFIVAATINVIVGLLLSKVKFLN